MKKARVLVLFDTDAEPPASQEYKKELESSDEAEFDIARALIAKGVEVKLLGFRDSLDQLMQGLRADPTPPEPLERPALDPDQVQDAMRSYRPPRR